MTRAIAGVLVLLLGSAAAVACGGANDVDFGKDDGAAGDPPATGGNGASSQGGSGGSATSGTGGGNQGGVSGTGGSASGGAATGGVSGTGTDTGGQPSGGNSGSGGTDPNGGVAGAVGGTSPGGAGGAGGTTDRGGGGGSGGKEDCDAIVSSAQAALLAATVCNPATTGPRCTGHVQDLCNCTVPVDNPDSEATRAYLAVREAAMRCGVPCLAIVCPEPTSTTSCAIGGVTTNIVAAQSRCVYVR